MSIRSMDSRLEVLRNGQDISNRSLLYSGGGGASQQQQQQPPIGDIDNESNKSDSWVELACPSRASMVSANGDNGSMIVVDSDGMPAGSETTAIANSCGNGSPFSRLSPISARSAPIDLIIDSGQGLSGDAMAVYHTRHAGGRRNGAGIGSGSKRTAEWLEGYNSRPEAQRGGVQAPSPVETELSTPPNSLVPGLDVADLTQSSCCDDEEEFSIADDGGYMCKCRKVIHAGHGIDEKGQWTLGGLLGLRGGNGRRALVLCLVTNLVTLAIGFAIGLAVGRKASMPYFRHRYFFD